MAYWARRGVWNRISAPIHSPLAWRVRWMIAAAAAAELRAEVGTLNLIKRMDLAPGGIAHRAGNVDLELQERHETIVVGVGPSGAEAQSFFFFRRRGWKPRPFKPIHTEN